MMRHLAILMLPLLLTACASGPPPQQRSPREDGPTGAPTPAAPRPTAEPTDARPSGGGGATPPAASTPAPVPEARPTAAPVTPTPVPAANPGGDRLATMRDIHDPAIIREGEWFYVFSTGGGVPIHRSRDLVTWEPAGRVFRLDVPDWAKREVPGSTIVWAPDIAHVDGRFVLTYSVGTFGQNRSVIGMASTPTLDQSRRDYNWRHDGKVVESFVGDDYNAIDSNLFVSGTRAVLSFGSYWTGVKLVELDRATLKPAPDAPRITLARRETSGGLEAPYIVERGGWYYLFLSFDKCCSGVESTYNIRVGRSRAIEGPYYDRENKPLTRGGGTVVLKTTGRIIGPGHCDVLQDGPNWYLVHHFYDGDARGVPTLQIRELLWDHLGWPRAGSVVGGL